MLRMFTSRLISSNSIRFYSNADILPNACYSNIDSLSVQIAATALLLYRIIPDENRQKIVAFFPKIGYTSWDAIRESRYSERIL